MLNILSSQLVAFSMALLSTASIVFAFTSISHSNFTNQYLALRKECIELTNLLLEQKYPSDDFVDISLKIESKYFNHSPFTVKGNISDVVNLLYGFIFNVLLKMTSKKVKSLIHQFYLPMVLTLVSATLSLTIVGIGITDISLPIFLVSASAFILALPIMLNIIFEINIIVDEIENVLNEIRQEIHTNIIGLKMVYHDNNEIEIDDA